MSKPNIKQNCGNCGAECYKHRREIKNSKSGFVFCSKSCAATFTNKLAPKRKKTRIPKEKKCIICTKDFLADYRKIRCEQCLVNHKTSVCYKNMTLEEYTSKLSVKGKHVSWKYAHIRNFNRSWNKELTKLPCQNCNYSHHVELAHIKAVSSFEPATKLSVVNSPDNIFVLCPNCHWEFDNGLLDSSNIPPRK